MITLTLLHPIQYTPIQSWRFEKESVIRIGRSSDNNVVLYSAVVSRRHVELRQNGRDWEIISLGTNGTYLDGTLITNVTVENGAIIRLARSGPLIQIHLGQYVPNPKVTQEKLADWTSKDKLMDGEPTDQEEITEPVTIPVLPPEQVPPSKLDSPPREHAKGQVNREK